MIRAVSLEAVSSERHPCPHVSNQGPLEAKERTEGRVQVPCPSPESWEDETGPALGLLGKVHPFLPPLFSRLIYNSL